MGITLTPVISSQLAAVGYDPTTQQLVIQFRHGGDPKPAYSYDGVPPDVAAGLLAAQSLGNYFHRYIRNGPYPFRRVEIAP